MMGCVSCGSVSISCSFILVILGAESHLNNLSGFRGPPHEAKEAERLGLVTMVVPLPNCKKRPEIWLRNSPSHLRSQYKRRSALSTTVSQWNSRRISIARPRSAGGFPELTTTEKEQRHLWQRGRPGSEENDTQQSALRCLLPTHVLQL
jgi:hypothetical protein